MGDSADSMVNGLLCEQCGVLIDGEEPGYPRSCSDCCDCWHMDEWDDTDRYEDDYYHNGGWESDWIDSEG